MGSPIIAALRKYRKEARCSSIRIPAALAERLVRFDPSHRNTSYHQESLKETARSLDLLVPSGPLTSKASALLHPKLAASSGVLSKCRDEVIRHFRTFASCSASYCGVDFGPHHEDDLGDFTFQLKGFDDNPKVLSHAAKHTITITDSALENFLIDPVGDNDLAEHEGRSHDSGAGLDVCPNGASTPGSDKDDIMSFLNDCFESKPIPVAEFFANKAHFSSAAPAFQGFFEENCSKEMKKQLQELELSDVKEKVLFPMFVDFCNDHYPHEMKRFRALLEAADMSNPHSLYSSARSFKRKIIYHHGPTNSGKTYNALQRFLRESSGIYCGPLRLLAMEVYDAANAKGVPCNLVTGQERKEQPLASHVACTVEMAGLQQVWKVAVIDEVQLLSDEGRGWAWTRALLGLQAEELHLCGDPSALAFVRSMCSATGDSLEEYSYERFKPLAVDPYTLNGDFRKVQPGDCVIAFSRRQIFDIKRAVERATQKRCCVVYGALPPETRSQQAKLFNEPGNSYDILVASDAVGMGLNLNIKRVVFLTLEKFDGELKNPIPVPLIKQIAGRAGRRGSLYPEGLVTTFQASDLPRLHTCLGEPFPESCNAGLFPSCEQLQLFAKHMPDVKFSELLDRFVQTSRVDSYYFVCLNMGLRRLSAMIDTIDNLTLEERFTFCFSPVNGRNPKAIAALFQYAKSYSQRIPLQLLVGRPSLSPHIDFQLMDLEEKYHLLSLYLWLSHHFPVEYFPQIQEAQTMSLEIASTLGESLADLRV
ncbi:hypothetical protein GOP47_0005605 [Adiantum capillus-veneris]|uniref:RNA helicase n=1 Tax=Adiantum capillus-veneris TaxID=13818 RepID=A0A9D4ZNP9_ADICA|nr:hypothetical protein GOP47_0005605 [Adiantum capillus-veneris]